MVSPRVTTTDYMSEINRDSPEHQLTKRVAQRTSGVTKAPLLERTRVITPTGDVQVTPHNVIVIVLNTREGLLFMPGSRTNRILFFPGDLAL